MDVHIPDSVTSILAYAFASCPIYCISWNRAISRSIDPSNDYVTADIPTQCCSSGQFIVEDFSFRAALTGKHDISPGNPNSYRSLLLDGSRTRSYSCSLCPSGTFAVGLAFTCTPCSPGFTSSPGASECHACPVGMAAFTPGSSTCTYWYSLYYS